jgi:aspartyl aminopeptidase
LDRDLSIAGIAYKTDLEEVLVDYKIPLAFIPSLSIHLDKERNIEAVDMIPILDEKLGQLLKDYLSYELFFYPVDTARLVGRNKKFLMGARLDNLVSCYMSCLLLKNATRNTLIYLANNEECGSLTKDGVCSSFILQFAPLMKANSFVVSLDCAHGLHPGFSEKFNSNHAPIVNKGMVVKVSSNFRYATSARTTALLEKRARNKNVPIQYFVPKIGTPCGSTVGPMLAAKLNLDTIDLGLATLAMHSCREVVGVDDFYSGLELVSAL